MWRGVQKCCTIMFYVGNAAFWFIFAAVLNVHGKLTDQAIWEENPIIPPVGAWPNWPFHGFTSEQCYCELHIVQTFLSSCITSLC